MEDIGIDERILEKLDGKGVDWIHLAWIRTSGGLL